MLERGNGDNEHELKKTTCEAVVKSLRGRSTCITFVPQVRKHMLQFRCLGIPVRVEPFFWLTLAILGALNTNRSIPDNSPIAILLIALFVLAGFISVLIHELGHALTARHFGAQVSIVLQALGGYARYSTHGVSRMQNIAITAAGPLLQILLGALVLGILKLAPPAQPAAAMFLIWLTAISFIWAIFNLVPILPMDGGRILQLALGPERIRITLWISIGTAAAMTIAAMTMGQLFIAIFMAMFGYQSWQALQQRGSH